MTDVKECSECKRVLPKTKDYFQVLFTRKCGFEARCKDCKKIYTDQKYLKDKIQAYQHYSKEIPECACCGEQRVEFLSIDHLNKDGAKHRKEYRGKYSSITLWLKHNNYPSGFRVLCMNCNTAIGFHGYCPHEKER